MKQIIPFTKNITFKSKIGELTSISLDNDLTLKGEDIITGNFYINGTYKMDGTILNPEKYSYKIPVEIAISDDYDTFDSTIDIDDFEYEVEDDTLKIKILVAIDNLVKKEKRKQEYIEDLDKEEKETNEEIIDKIDKELKQEINNTEEVENNRKETKTFLEKKEEIKNEKDEFLTYSIYIVKEEDTINKIKEKYNVTEEVLKDYNTLEDLKPGMKLIIPSTND